MSAYVIRCVCCADGNPSAYEGQYLAAFNPDALNGEGVAHWTLDRGRALRFHNAGEACAAWRARSSARPLRLDGEPNRPLTAYAVKVVRA